jgi:hypothetical protein
LARTVVGHFFWIAAGALFPPALALYPLPPIMVWKVSALLFGLPMLLVLLTYHHRRMALTTKPAPAVILALFLGVGCCSIAGMIAYVFAGFAHPEAAYAMAILANFLAHGYTVVVALEVILTQQAIPPPVMKPHVN